MIEIMAIFDFIGMIFFIMAAVFAVKNYSKTKELSDYWLVLVAALAIGVIWSLFILLEWLGIYPLVFDEVQQPLQTAMATAFALAALLTVVSLVQPVD